MKKNIKLLRMIMPFFILFITACLPKVEKEAGQNYTIINWDGGEFCYVTYIWNGGKFDEAIALTEKLDELKKERGLNEQALGRFPSGKEWQMGFILQASLNEQEVMGYPIKHMTIPGGTYASLKVKGWPEIIFVFWKPFKKWLIKDGYTVDSPVYEIYRDDTFDKTIPSAKRTGELRYKVSTSKE